MATDSPVVRPTVKCRTLHPDGGFVLDGFLWEVVQRAVWMTLEKTPVFVVVHQVDSATLYADRACTERLGSARRGLKL